MKERLSELKKVEKKLKVKKNLKTGLKGAAIAMPVLGIIAVGYFGLKTSTNPDYNDFIGGD